MRILITGSNGFIGGHLASSISAHGHRVVALSRSGTSKTPEVDPFAWSMGQPVPKAAEHEVSCAIHLAHDFAGEEGARRTVDSTLRIVQQLRRAGVQRQLFFSSYSAGEHASSLYGRTKLAIENALRSNPDIVLVRPGLVLGDGGIYQRIRKWAQWLPVIPLPDGGYGTVPVIGIQRLCEETLRLAIEPTVEDEANLFEPELRSLRCLVLDAAREVGRNRRILPIPSFFLAACLNAAELLRLPLPINVDNLDGFIANQRAKHRSNFEECG